MNNHLHFRLMFAVALVFCTQSLHGYRQTAPLSLGDPVVFHGAHALLAASVPFTAQQTKVLAPHKPIAPLVPAAKQPPLPPARSGSMIGGIWMTDADYKSSIYLRNIVETSAITVVPVLWLSNGTSYVLDAVTIDAAGTKVVDINAGLQSKGIASYATLSGYVELRYNWPWVPLCATIRNVDTAHSLIFTYGLGPSTTPAAVTEPKVQTVAEGLWWKQEPAVSAFVTLSNPATVSIPATVQVMDDQGSELESQAVTVSPHGTKLVQISSLELTPRTIGGIHITYQAPPGATLLLTGGLEDQNSGYSAAIPFVTLSSAAAKSFSTTITELGLMVGASDPMMNFPAGTRFTPYSVIRNVTKAAMTFSPTLWWMEGGAARSFALPALTLMPNQAQQLNVPAYLSAAGLDHFNGNFNLVLNAQGQHGGLLMAAGSVDDKNTYVFEVIPRGVAASASKSLSYWSTGNGDDTMVTMWNPADEAQDLIFRLFFNGGHYAYPVHLAARATQTLNISELIENQTPDTDGNVIPASVHEGSAKIAGQGADNQQILVAVDAGVYNVKKATCGEECWTCDGANDATLTPSPFTVDVDDGTVQMDFQITWDTGASYNETSDASWSGSGVSVSSSGVVSGTTAGSASVGAEYDGPVYTTICLELPADDPCPIEDDYGASASGTVNDPTPSISEITPSTWEAGASGQSFTITGSNFGTNKPTLNFDPSSGISYTITSNSDSSISGSYSVTSGTPTETVQVSVTSTGFGGNKFQSNGGNSATSSSSSVQVDSVTINQNQSLGFFGSGISTPPNFYLYYSNATFTASGASGGSFSWTLSDSTKATFSSNGATQASTTTTANSVVVYGLGASSSLKDQTITLKWTPAGGNPLTKTNTFTVYQPYELTSTSITGPFAVSACAPTFPSGNVGWHYTYKWQMFDQFQNALSGMSLNEQFTNVTAIYPGENLSYTPNGTSGSPGVSTFQDDYCYANNTAGRPPSEPPQNPLSTTQIDSATQTYRLGSSTVGSGVAVQTQSLTRYVDHIVVSGISDPQK